VNEPAVGSVKMYLGEMLYLSEGSYQSVTQRYDTEDQNITSFNLMFF